MVLQGRLDYGDQDVQYIVQINQYVNHMELRHARYFLAVAEALSFTKAAQRLNLSQPPLSQQIAALENELGVRLFDRHSRNVALTAAGIAFRRHAETMLAQASQAAADVGAIGKGLTGTLHVAATSSVLYSGLSSRISGFLGVNRDVAIAIHEMSPHDQLEGLKSQRLDLCFLRSAPEEPGTTAELIWTERVGIIVPEGHRLERRKSVGISSLRDESFVFYRRRDSAFAQQLHAACVAQGFAPRIVQEVIESFSLYSLVTAGLGIGFVPERLGRLPGARFIPLRGPVPRADVHVLMGRAPSPLAKRFVAFAQSESVRRTGRIR